MPFFVLLSCDLIIIYGQSLSYFKHIYMSMLIGRFSPATGLIVYNTSVNKYNYYNGTSWVILFSGTSVINSVTGTAGRITIGGTASDPTFDISSSYVGQASINTLGTIGTGVWNGTVGSLNTLVGGVSDPLRLGMDAPVALGTSRYAMSTSAVTTMYGG